MDPIDPVIGVRNPDRVAEKLRDSKYRPENNISLIEIADAYRQRNLRIPPENAS